MIFRHGGHPLPASRGGLSASSCDRTVRTMTAAGRGDVPEERAGAWELEERGPSLRLRIEIEPEGILRLVSVEADRLVGKKP